MAGLAGKVAVITGASRGIGKGVALTLAERGATVYVTGRTVESESGPYPGSIGATVDACNERGADSGGKAIGVALDVRSEASIAALFEQVARDQGRLDLLVNNAMTIPDLVTERIGFWEKLLSELEIVDTGVHGAYAAAWHAANIMVPQGSGLIVAMSGYSGVSYTNDVLLGTAKCAIDRMARDMAIDLKPHNVASLSLWQGFTFTERSVEKVKAMPDIAKQLKGLVRSLGVSSIEFPGRIIAVLAQDEKIMEKTGGTFINAELAIEYGVTDTRGSTPPSLREQRGSPIWKPV